MSSDTSQDSEVFLARQPIFDRTHHVVGYELLFRDGDAVNAASIDGDGTEASAEVMMGAVTELGLDRLVGTATAWVNLTREALLSGLGLALPVRSTCFEILEDQQVDTELVDAIVELKASGYRIALDDFEYRPELEPLLALANFVKLDFAALGPERFATQVNVLKPRGIAIVAEKLETPAQHEYCMTRGCSLFQGFFYQKPEVLSERRIELTHGSKLQLIAALQDPALALEDLEPLIALDVPLSLRLMRYLNSAFLGLACEVTSVRQALIMLGLDNVRRWATLTTMSTIEGKTSELTVASLLRARFCELAAAGAGLDSAQLFTVGMFSLLDAMLDMPLQDALDELPFPHEIRNALLYRAGRMGEILTAAVALESDSPGEDALLVNGAVRLHGQALLWTQEAAETLVESATATASVAA